MPAREELLTVPAEDTGKRLDAWLAAQPALAMTRSAVQQLLEQGQITRNGKAAKKNDKLQSGDEIRVAVPEPQTLDVLPQDIPLEII